MHKVLITYLPFFIGLCALLTLKFVPLRPKSEQWLKKLHIIFQFC